MKTAISYTGCYVRIVWPWQSQLNFISLIFDVQSRSVISRNKWPYRIHKHSKAVLPSKTNRKEESATMRIQWRPIFRTEYRKWQFSITQHDEHWTRNVANYGQILHEQARSLRMDSAPPPKKKKQHAVFNSLSLERGTPAKRTAAKLFCGSQLM